MVSIQDYYSSSMRFILFNHRINFKIHSCTNHTLHEKDAAIDARIHDLKNYPALLRNFEAKSKLTRGDVKQKVLLARTALEEVLR